MTLSTILFDKDGTLYDFHGSWAGWVEGMLADLSGGDGALAAAMGHAVGFDTDTGNFERHSLIIAATPGEITDALMPFVETRSRADVLAQLDAGAMAVEMAPALPLKPYLAGLAGRGMQLGVVTNDTEGAARAHLEASGIIEAFGVIVGYDSGFGAKPAPGPVLAAVDALGGHPDAAVMVGDSTHDLVAGRAAGLRTVGVLTGIADADDLSPFADVVLPDIGALPAWLDTQV